MRASIGLVLCVFSLAVNAVSPSVTIDQGVYVGVTTQLATATPVVNKWIGIPYAEPPERFAPPKARAKSSTTKQLGTLQPPTCVQDFPGNNEKVAIFDFLFNNPKVNESEDCLFLNVYAPANAKASSLTVLVWILPGAFQFGGGTQDIFDGSKWAAEQDVVIVTGNHRTNVFGFPGQPPQVPAESRNLGLQDLDLYLQWVQENIGQFGGDPKKVTLFGESSGAVAVDYFTLSKRENPPFRAVIMQSGTALISPASAFDWSALQPANVPGPPWDVLAQALGCSGDYDAVFQCIKIAPAEQVRGVARNQSLAFPFVVVDNKTIYEDSLGRRQQGLVAKVPVLIGSNADEGRLFLGIALAGSASDLDPGYAIGTAPILGGLIPDSWKPSSVRRGFSTASFGLINGGIISGASRLLGDVAFNCPAQRTANASANLGVKTWRYFYNVTLTDGCRGLPDLLAAHNCEVDMLWGTYNVFPNPPTANELAITKLLQSTWATFAKDPESGPGWSQYGTTDGQQIIAELGGDNVAHIRETNPDDKLDTLCAGLGPLDEVLGNITLNDGGMISNASSLASG